MTATLDEPRTRVQLALEGMTCASCATRIERKLNKLEGVEASVNLATEQATVSYDPARAAVDDLIRAVEAAGYRASVEARAEADETSARVLRARLLVAARTDGAPARGEHGPAAPVRRLGVARVRARHAGRLLGGLGVPPRRGAERTAPGGDDGHADLDRHPRRVGVVGRGARRARRRAHLLRGGRGDHDPDPAWPLPRSTRQAAFERGDPRAPRAGRQGGAPAARGRRGGRAGGRGAARRPLRRPAGREDRNRRARRRRLFRRRPVDAHRRAGAGRGRPGRRGRGSHTEHLRASRSCARPKSVPRPRWRRSRAWSRRRRPARRRSSASSTASPPSSFRS